MKDSKSIYNVGIDVGSTTLKMVVLDAECAALYKVYKRHKADINGAFIEEIKNIKSKFPDKSFRMNITGSAGMGISERTGIPFVQEVVASVEVINKIYPETHVMIDLGGEDSKMVFFQDGRQPDIRMNGSCAGGTGAFIDQMADLMNISVDELSNQAVKSEKIYPVASRCGVFAKTDVQNLISRNVPIPDISMSILHTVALQSITSLARGYKISSGILCIGGPLTFIPSLRESFRKILNVDNENFILPENSEYFPAWGCALCCREDSSVQDPDTLLLQLAEKNDSKEKNTLPVLFKNATDYSEWKKNRKIKSLKRATLGETKEVNCFLGIDSGSTTTKILVMDEDERILYTFYAPNEGNPLKKVIEGLQGFYKEAADKGVAFRFIGSTATGYGEDLVKSALNLDFGIVETMAHLSGAQYVDPDVTFVLDIGGQDIKSIFTNKGVISSIELNEACSSGCGSFLQNFASTMNLRLPDFTEKACMAVYPADLGSRCTVFMNSKVKQSLRQNAGLGDIAAGLAYSVVKNCLFKVLKISTLNKLGNHIVVQGGTFRNDAVYRALELLSGKSVSSTDHPELMGALGAALYAKKRWLSTSFQTAFTGEQSLPDAKHIQTKEVQCKGCTNTCSVLRFKFENGNICYAGNKCEKVFYNKATMPEKGINAFELKSNLIFQRNEQVVEKKQAGIKIGIPRVLNIFEDFPFWHTLFTECGFEVALSPESTPSLYQRGVGSVMSDNICFPAKLAHGHILSLIEQGVDRIFYPIIPKEEKDFKSSCNSYNCPVVSGYPDVIRSSIDPAANYGIPFDKPVITFGDYKALKKACYKYVAALGVTKQVFNQSFKKAQEELHNTKKLLGEKQSRLLHEAIDKHELVFIVAGRPYHTDPLVHQKIGQILSDLGATVLTDDIFCTTENNGFLNLNIVSQWSYPNRVVQAAMEVARLPENVQLIQLNSFGCGPDSFFMDEITEILKQSGKNHTIIRIDEIASPGSVRLRLRSLIESLKVTNKNTDSKSGETHFKAYPTVYSENDRRKSILIPWFADFISPFVPAIGKLAGYDIVNLPKSSKASAEAGLKYGHNEVCYPSTLILGDMITALQSGDYDLDNVVMGITQTGGQCRATNYVSQIKAGLANAGFESVPVIVLSTGSVYQNEQQAFKFPIMKLAGIIVYAVLYGDALQQMYSATIIREKKKGATQQLFDFYVERGIEAIEANDYKMLLQLLNQAVGDFNQIAVHEQEFSKVGLIGEIYVKYNNYGQAYITQWLREKGMEVVTPPIIDFLMQYFVNSEVNDKNGVKRSILKTFLNPLFWKYMNVRISKVDGLMKKFRFYQANESIYVKAKYASEILDLSNQFGEGWTIAAEVATYSHHGIKRIVCIQPFGCIANHIVAKGIEKRLKSFYPDISLLYLDIDGGMAEVNLQNRLHFLIS
ncbi:MAG: acyl-CoA dehydratase activase-related protein [Tannerella sp.]|nr:acyl-CoA dehydratase activase-related protein [Tannerella sp.]